MATEERPSTDTDLFSPGDRFGVVWKDVDPAEPHDGALAAGCVRFNRLEGCHFAGGAFWFDDTAGGEKRLGQVFRLIPGQENVPGSDTLELFAEGTDVNEMESPDNLVVTPWGDIWFAEDGDGENRLMGIRPDGTTYTFAGNRVSDGELAGPTFSPDGRTLFVNIQTPAITFAVWGPFARQNRFAQRQMAHAAPPPALAPRISGELAEAARRYGMSELEAAAYDRLGVVLT